MSDYIIAVSKTGFDVKDEIDPNNFIFHSLYNTFKIIKTGTLTCSVLGSINSQIFTKAHNLSFIPLITAFAKDNAQSEVFPPNSENIYGYGLKTGLFGTGVKLISISSDDTNMIFKFDNSGTTKTVKVRYFCLETI